jgi:hypothetical protein
MLQGSNTLPNQQYLQQCVQDCNSNWSATYSADLKVKKREILLIEFFIEMYIKYFFRKMRLILKESSENVLRLG